MTTLPAIQRQECLGSLSSYIKASVADGTTLGLLLIDLVNISQINRIFGYAHGDELLSECFQKLIAISRLPDTVYRVGDHQFAFIISDLKNPSFIALAINKVEKLLQGEVSFNDKVMDIDIRVGVVVNKTAEFCAEETLLIAESSLKNAKKNKQKFSVYRSDKEDKNSQVLEKMFLEKLKSNDFELFYQPKINLQTGVLDSAEALLRWRMPDGDFISPEVAVDIAERTGQIFALTKWVIHNAIRQIKHWQEQGLLLSVAVNIPASLVQHPDLCTLVKDSLAIWGVDKKLLTLEITESAIIEDKEAGFFNLLKLKEYGVKLSIDDFGTGYSSLSYFKHIPACELKIDKVFIFNMLTCIEDQRIVKIIIEIARSFQLQVVAEGIENQETYDYLRKLGCNYGQGYHMARPMPVDKFYRYWMDRYAG
jgi:diguanylate cyclase (GGDEF)-like protein